MKTTRKVPYKKIVIDNPEQELKEINKLIYKDFLNNITDEIKWNKKRYIKAILSKVN